MQTNPPILSSVPDKLKSDCINQLDQLLTVVKSSELTAVDLLPKRASAARERRASAARSRAAAVARVKRAAAARQQAAARATARKKYYAQQAAAAARKASIAKAKAAAVVVANRAAAARRQAVAVAAAAAATAAANKRRKEQEDAKKKLAIQAAIKQAEKAEQTRIAQVAAQNKAVEEQKRKRDIQAAIALAEKAEQTRLDNIAAQNKAVEEQKRKRDMQASIRAAEKAETVRFAEVASNMKKVEVAMVATDAVVSLTQVKVEASKQSVFKSPSLTNHYNHLMNSGNGISINKLANKVTLVGLAADIVGAGVNGWNSEKDKAPLASKITSTITSSLKEVDNIYVASRGGILGYAAGTIEGLGVVSAVTGPLGSVSGAYIANEAYKESGGDDRFNSAIDVLEPYIYSKVKASVDTLSAVHGAVVTIQKSLITSNSPQNLLINSN